MAHEETAAEPLDLKDIIRGTVDLADDFDWSDGALATAIHGVVRPLSGLAGGEVEDAADRLSVLANILGTHLKALDDGVNFSALRPKDLIDLGPRYAEVAADHLARSLLTGFPDVEFLRLEAVVLRALEIVRSKTEGVA